MRLKELDEIEIECKRFLRRVWQAKARLRKEHRMDEFCKTRPVEEYYLQGVAETGALRRASMDLSRVLTKLRA